MKKLLTVLLVIAVMFTFSFSSAFATTPMGQTGAYDAATSYDKLYNDTAYSAYTGQYGITEAYRAALVKDWTKVLNNSDPVTNFTSATNSYGISYANYFSAEYDTAKAAVESAIETFKTATTAKAAKVAEAALVEKLHKLRKAYVTSTNGANIGSTYTFASQLNIGMGSYLGSTGVDYLLPGYGYVDGNEVNRPVATLTSCPTSTNVVHAWLADNGYRTALAAKGQLTALKAALVPLTEANIKAIQEEYNAINTKVLAATNAWTAGGNFAVGTVDGLDLDSLEALIKEAKAFEAKYTPDATAKAYATASDLFADWAGSFASYNNIKAGKAQEYLEYVYFNQYANEIKTVDLTDKAAVVALMDKIDDLKGAYDHVAQTNVINSTDAYTKLVNAYNAFIKADKEALDAANVDWKWVSEGKDSTYYFDTDEENVAKMDALRKAYDEVVSNYGYALDNPALTYANCDEIEAKLLAGEHNKAAAAGYDEKDSKIDNTKLQAYLNNATLTVKSTKLAAKKVKVQAKFSAADYKGVVEEFGTGYTMSYKFYFKAPGKSYKLTKTKDVNYITYTSKSLKAGKNYFKVGVVVKNADGKVVAEKLYNASNAAYRTIK